jgi:hypothetical protein
VLGLDLGPVLTHLLVHDVLSNLGSHVLGGVLLGFLGWLVQLLGCDLLLDVRLLFDLGDHFRLSLDHVLVLFLVLDDCLQLVGEPVSNSLYLLLNGIELIAALLYLTLDDLLQLLVGLTLLAYHVIDEVQAVTQMRVGLSIGLYYGFSQALSQVVQVLRQSSKEL